MADRVREFSLAGVFNARENIPSDNEIVYLTRIKGWDEFATEILTVPKLFGRGSYVTETHVPDREIELSIVCVDTTVRNLQRSLEAKALEQALTRNTITATRTIGSSAESLQVFITGVSEYIEWSDTAGQVNITLKAVNPVKSVN